MGLMDSLRKAEQQGRQAARRSLEHAREGWEDAERRIRRRMRIYPRPGARGPVPGPGPEPVANATSRNSVHAAEEHDINNRAA